MSFDKAIKALSADAVRRVRDGDILGLGSGRAATSFVESLGRRISSENLDVVGIPTSLQIKIAAEKNGIRMADAGSIDVIDAVFDGADQIDADGYLVKGGGGALLRENILIGAAKKVVIMADATKFVKKINMRIPVEVHPHARATASRMIRSHGGTAYLRTLERGYPFFTENGNIILDCDFGRVENPRALARRIIGIPGVAEAGIFVKRPDVIYKANKSGTFDVISMRSG